MSQCVLVRYNNKNEYLKQLQKTLMLITFEFISHYCINLSCYMLHVDYLLTYYDGRTLHFNDNILPIMFQNIIAMMILLSYINETTIRCVRHQLLSKNLLLFYDHLMIGCHSYESNENILLILMFSLEQKKLKMMC